MNIESNSQSHRAAYFGGWGDRLVRCLAWTVGTLTFLNALYYILRTANPVIRSDGWYFLDVFVRRVLDGTVGLGDFFVKRHGADHAQPMGKLLLLVQLRYFDLDFSIESIVGVLSAAVCALLLYCIVAKSRWNDRTDMGRHVAWVAMCAVLFSLNAPGIWTWPLVAMQYLTFIPALLFTWTVWRSWQTGKYVLLAVITVTMGVVDDDSAIIIIVAVIAAMLFAMICNTAPRDRKAWLTIAVVLLCVSVVRLCYGLAPVEGGAPMSPLSSYLTSLHERLNEGGGLSWIFIPLGLSVVPHTPSWGFSASSWNHVVSGVVAILLIAHGVFWWRAIRTRYNLATFIAVCLMLLSYAWLAGVLVYRVSDYGNDYLYQERYVFLYQFNLIALLLFWAGSPKTEPVASATKYGWISRWLPVVGSLALILLQVPLSSSAWHSRRYLVAYYHQMAVQLERLADNSEDTKGCLPELVVCTQPLPVRKELVQLLVAHRLNVFSPRMHDWHPYIPRYQDVPQEGVRKDPSSR